MHINGPGGAYTLKRKKVSSQKTALVLVQGSHQLLQVVDSVPGGMEFMMRMLDSLKTTMMDGKRLKSEKASWMVCPAPMNCLSFPLHHMQCSMHASEPA